MNSISIDLSPTFYSDRFFLKPWIFIHGVGKANTTIEGEDTWFTHWRTSDLEELYQLQLAQRVFDTVPLPKINSNNWAGILAEQTGECVR